MAARNTLPYQSDNIHKPIKIKYKAHLNIFISRQAGKSCQVMGWTKGEF